MITTGTAPFEMIENGAAVMCYPVTFDGRKVTVHTPDGPRTRTRRHCGGYATAAVLRAMGYTDLVGTISGDGDDEKITHYTAAYADGATAYFDDTYPDGTDPEATS